MMDRERDRIDVLLYAHDGRGFGHASRSVAIGLALRRLYPDLRVMLVSGSSAIETLVSGAPLDWIKLPALRTDLVEGRGDRQPAANLLPPGRVLRVRAHLLRRILRDLVPRVVVVDYAPLGQHDELSEALFSPEARRCRWICGMRAVPGEHKSIWSQRAAAVLRERYDTLLWYGDRGLIGGDIPQRLATHFGKQIIETGYVSRAREVEAWLGEIRPQESRLDGVVALPWLTNESGRLLRDLALAIEQCAHEPTRWRFFIGQTLTDRLANTAIAQLADRQWVRIERFSEAYLAAVRSARMVVGCAGYNTVTDVLWADRPAVLLCRGSLDGEQQRHAQLIAGCSRGRIQALDEASATSGELSAAIERALGMTDLPGLHTSLAGSTSAAHAIAAVVHRPPAPPWHGLCRRLASVYDRFQGKP